MNGAYKTHPAMSVVDDDQSFDWSLFSHRHLEAKGGQKFITVVFGIIVMLVVLYLAYQGR
jgi:hypothetical protein